MIEFFSYLFVELFFYVLCRGVGHLTVFVFSFGQSRCDDNTADILGAIVLMAIVVFLLIWLWR